MTVDSCAKPMKTTLPLLLLLASSLSAGFVERPVRYSVGETACEGVLVYHESLEAPAPAVLMVPNWMGVTPAALEKARILADDDFVFFVADMYGADVRPADASEAGAAAGAVRADRELQRARAQGALDTFLALADAPLDPERVAAIGFCFGGGTVLELGRAGADLDAIVSFHGDLASPTLEDDAPATRAKVLVLHGAADPYVPQDHVQRFVAAMMETDVDWQLVQFGGVVHSFTDPLADSPGQADYDETAAKRSFGMMDDLFDEVFGE
jgi:dienelactone hydrolase